MSELPAKPPTAGIRAGPGCFARSVAFLVAALGTLYLLNPTGGMFEPFPDLMPFLGNLDEAGVTAAVLFALRTLFKRSAR